MSRPRRRRCLIAYSQESDTSFSRGTKLWIVDAPDADGLLGVLGFVVPNVAVITRRHPTQVDKLQVAIETDRKIQKKIAHWAPQFDELPGWVGRLAFS